MNSVRYELNSLFRKKNNLYVYAVMMIDVQNDANQSCMNDKYTITLGFLVAIFPASVNNRIILNQVLFLFYVNEIFYLHFACIISKFFSARFYRTHG